ncbi:hypothetical protein B0I35DRAFT_485209 [Stachybotrys elegans]|uniref:Uncharacterized protein n=1 Tax=Stachybotrys elegans TaxID=80388 RepID=A0A8K0WIQ6_9HYPO|nr:hypothetical protein B0I35DRAFT_485209 [Stachybotrys elegans]
MHILAVQDGLVPESGTKPKSNKWLVLPTAFSFTVTTKVPVNFAIVATTYGDEVPVEACPVNGPAGAAIYARPMGQQGMTLKSTLKVKNDPSLLNGTISMTTALLTGVSLIHPEPSKPDTDTLKQFDYRRFMAQNVQDPDGRHRFPELIKPPKCFEAEKPAEEGPEK